MVKPINKNFILTIKPAIPPKERHAVEDTLKKVGYDVAGGGQMINGEQSDISFSLGIDKLWMDE